jgi:hypothetical protein
MGLLLFALFITEILAKFDFYSPEILRENYKENGMKYNMLNMGDIPYGRSIIGKVVKAEPYDGCGPL